MICPFCNNKVFSTTCCSGKFFEKEYLDSVICKIQRVQFGNFKAEQIFYTDGSVKCSIHINNQTISFNKEVKFTKEEIDKFLAIS